MKTYKGFDKNLKCRNFQFEEGKEYQHDGEIKCCKSGFHSCENPLDIFNYYTPSESVYHEVEIDGNTDRGGGDNKDSKIASSKIKIGASINLKTIVDLAVKFIFEKCDWTKENKKGDRGAASQTGDRGAASQTGDRGAASQTGDRGAAISLGPYSSSQITNTDEIKSGNSTAIALGTNSKARAPKECWIVIAEHKKTGGIKSIKTAFVDGVKIKENVWYNLKNGKFVKEK